MLAYSIACGCVSSASSESTLAEGEILRLLFQSFAIISAIYLTSGCMPPPQNPNEIQDGRIIIHQLNAALLREKVMEQKSYLLNARNPKYSGYYKKYDPETDTAETRLRTVYSASAGFSLLKMKQFEGDASLDPVLASIVSFIRFMQVKEGPLKGAFHYAYNPITKIKEPRFVVGSASKVIYTLVNLYNDSPKTEYLQMANDAAAWLMKQVDSLGNVYPETFLIETQSTVTKKKSYLYSGQVLSALSRLYAVTKDPQLYQTAEKIAAQLLRDAKQQNYFMGDDYRRPNTVSTSWIMMSFIDFSRVNPADKAIQDALFKTADALLAHQVLDPSNLLRYGRFNDTDAASGNGWINEVLVEGYKLCMDRKLDGCQRYLEASVKDTRWLIQNIYSAENSAHLPNPKRALGGLIRNNAERTVRTDAVCHSINGMVELLQLMPDLSFQVPK